MLFRSIDGVEIFTDIAAAEAFWQSLERADSLATPYQRYDLLKLWQIHVGAPASVTPLIVVGINPTNVPLFVLPLGRRTVRGWRVAEFLGGKHANFNMGLWRRDVAAKLTVSDLRPVLEQLSNHADVLKLIHQPITWTDRKSTRLNSSHIPLSRMPSSA